MFPSAFRNSPLFVGKDYEPKEDAWESNHQEEEEINSTEFLTKVGPRSLALQAVTNVNIILSITSRYLNFDSQSLYPCLVIQKQAERLFCIVMPQADRNMFVALKQERFAGSVSYFITCFLFNDL